MAVLVQATEPGPAGAAELPWASRTAPAPHYPQPLQLLL